MWQFIEFERLEVGGYKFQTKDEWLLSNAEEMLMKQVFGSNMAVSDNCNSLQVFLGFLKMTIY